MGRITTQHPGRRRIGQRIGQRLVGAVVAAAVLSGAMGCGRGDPARQGPAASDSPLVEGSVPEGADPVDETAQADGAALAACLEVGAALAALRLAPVGGPATVEEVAAALDELAPSAPAEVVARLERLASELAAGGPSVLEDADGAYAEAEAEVLDHLERTCGSG